MKWDQRMKTHEYIKCGDCWWCLNHSNSHILQEKGQCLMYGFFVNKNSTICCDYTRGKR